MYIQKNLFQMKTFMHLGVWVFLSIIDDIFLNYFKKRLKTRFLHFAWILWEIKYNFAITVTVRKPDVRILAFLKHVRLPNMSGFRTAKSQSTKRPVIERPIPT